MAGALLLPLLVMLGFMAYRSVKTAEADAYKAVLDAAQTRARAIEIELGSMRELLSAIAQRPLVRSLDPSRCDPFLQELRAIDARVANIGLRTRAGEAMCLQRSENVLSVAQIRDSEWFREAIAGDGFRASNAFVAKTLGHWVVALSQTVHDASGAPAAVLAAATPIERLATWITRGEPIEGGVSLLVDRSGRVIAGSLDNQAWLGKELPKAEPIDKVLSGADGNYRVRGPDGVERVYGVATVPSAGWKVLVRMPTEAMSALVRQQVRESLLVLGGFALLACVLALAFAHKLSGAIRRPRDLVRATAQGRFQLPIPVRGPGEVAELTEEFNRMVAAQQRAEQALREAQALYRSVFENSVVGIFVVAADGRVVSANPALGRILGYESSEEMMAQISSVARQVYAAAGDRSRFHELIRSKGIVEGFQTRWRRRDGSLIWVSLSARRVDDPAIGHIGMAEDITERKRAERLRALEHGVTRCLAEAESASAAIQSVIRTICEAEEWPCGRYFTADEATGVLRFAEAWSRGDPAAEQFIARSRELVYRRGQGLSGTAWQTGRPLWVADVSKDARASGSSGSASGPSLQGGSFVLPVKLEDKTLGVLSFSSAATREPDERFLQATAVIGSQIGQFLARMQAETAMRHSESALRRAELMAKLAHIVTGPAGGVESWSETFPRLIGVDPGELAVGSTRDWLEFLHPDGREAFRQTSIEAAASGKRRDMEYRLQRRNGEWVHVRHVMEPMQSHPHGPSSMRWFSTLQDITEQKRAEDKIRRLNRVYAVLSGINSLIVRVRSRDELFKEACRIAVEEGQFPVAWIGVVDQAAACVKPVAWQGTDERILGQIRMGLHESAPEGIGIVGRAVNEGMPVISNDLEHDPRVLVKGVLERGARSLALLPLVVGSDTCAVLVLYAPVVGFFDGDEMKLLLELAGDIALALDHIEKAEKLDYLPITMRSPGSPTGRCFTSAWRST
jgi:PAS domain S-box-containing protein